MTRIDSGYARLAPAALLLVGQLAFTGTAGAVVAIPSFQLNGRSADLYLSQMSGGVGTAGVSIAPGIGQVSSNELAPSFLQIVGADTSSVVSGVFTGTIEGQWDLRQDYAVSQTGAGVVLAASGSMDVRGSSFGSIGEVPSVGPFIHDKYNYQSLRFSLSGDTSYAVSGTTWGDEYIDVRLGGSNAPYGPWNWIATVGFGETPTNWSFSGVLAAGDYVISNRRIPLNNSGWSYTLTLQGATLAPVPEPKAYATLLLGLVLVGLRMFRNARWTSPV